MKMNRLKKKRKTGERMERILTKIYEEIISYESDAVQMDQDVVKELDKVMAGSALKLSDEDKEGVREVCYQVALTAERKGFYLGMRYLFRFLVALLQE